MSYVILPECAVTHIKLENNRSNNRIFLEHSCAEQFFTQKQSDNNNLNRKFM
jgi:hypothetical protein